MQTTNLKSVRKNSLHSGSYSSMLPNAKYHYKDQVDSKDKNSEGDEFENQNHIVKDKDKSL